MSGRYVSRVLESNLAAHLSKTAEAFATFADEDGCKIRPSVAYVAWLTKQSERTVQNHLAALRKMEILVERIPATQHRPAEYAMDLAKLPARPAFRLPEVQLAAPLDLPPEVQPAAPLTARGATLDARGATAVAPDPSLDPKYVQTHTPRARETPAVQPVAPLDDPSLPLVGPTPPPRCAHPHRHAWCAGRVHVPRDLHFEFLDKLGTQPGESPASKAGRLVAFYAWTMRHLSPEATIGDAYAFWKAAYTAWVGHTETRAAVQRRREGVPSGLVSCDHDPRCATWHACIDRTLADGRAARARQAG
jgi:hypothetical protein